MERPDRRDDRTLMREVAMDQPQTAPPVFPFLYEPRNFAPHWLGRDKYVSSRDGALGLAPLGAARHGTDNGEQEAEEVAAGLPPRSSRHDA